MPTRKEPTREWKLHVPQELALQIEHMLLDHRRQRVRYGARNELVIALLRRFMREHEAAKQQQREPTP